jgi:hypothetical protein
MNLARFQLALNHEDPEIATKGLNEFREKILVDHNATVTFGYNGRPARASYDFFSEHPNEVVGLLKDYIQSSPQVEELFILLQLPGRTENVSLVVAHTACISAILHCGKSNSRCCDSIVSRILSEFSRTFSNQLTTSHTSIVHCTLGLFLAMCRTSPQNARDAYNRLVSHTSSLNSLLQKGKSVSFEGDDNFKISTDSRYLIILLVFTLLLHADGVISSELLTHRGLFSRVTNGILKDSPPTLRLICSSVLSLLSLSSVPFSTKVDLIDPAFLQKLIEVNRSEDSEISSLVDSILIDYANHIAYVSGGAAKKQQGGGLVNNKVYMLLKALQPHCNTFHEQVYYECVYEPRKK